MPGTDLPLDLKSVIGDDGDGDNCPICLEGDGK